MCFRCPILLALFGLASCSSKPVDCYNVAPTDCGKYSQCRSIVAGWLDDQCVEEIDPVACWPADVPGCQLTFGLRDPAGHCWGMADCFVPQGWQDDDGTCYKSGEANYNACYPQDAGTVGDSGTGNAGDTGGD